MSQATATDSVNVVCPHCSRVVRVPGTRLADGPRCPACKGELLDGKPVQLDDTNFDAFVARSELPVLVDFWAPWCGPCRTFGPIVAQAAAELAPGVVVAKVDSDVAQRTAGRLGIRSIPTVALYVRGREVARQAGAMPLSALKQWLAGAVASAG